MEALFPTETFNFHSLYQVVSQDTVLNISCGSIEGAFVGHSLYAHMYAESPQKA